MAPPYLGKTLDGDEIALGKYAGKVVVVSFWATWCPYCLKELPILEGIQRSTKGAVQVVAVNTEKREVFRKVASTLSSLTFQLTRDYDSKAYEAYGVTGIPHLVIIGRDGRITKVFQGYGEETLGRIVDELNKAIRAEPASPADEAKP